MTQQYVLLRKENDLLNSLIGQSFNEKSKFEAYKILKEIHSKAQRRSIDKKALCYVVDKNEILGVGGSTLMKEKKTGKIESNLILDNFGKWLSANWKGGTLGLGVALLDEFGTPRFFNIYTNTNQYNNASAFRFLMQVGAGTTAPARTDFDLETPFVTGTEALRFESTIPFYNATVFNFKNTGSVTAGGTGTVNEAVIQPIWRDSALASRVVTLYHDLISPGVPFIPGQTIALEYTTQI